jgi:hypothetical protein
MTDFYRTARTRFDHLLVDEYKFKLAYEQYDYESFGNARVEYSRRGIRLRLIWDGREGILTLQYQRRALSRIPLGGWHDVEGVDGVPHSGTGEQSDVRIAQLEARTRELLKEWHTPAFLRRERARHLDQPPNDR